MGRHWNNILHGWTNCTGQWCKVANVATKNMNIIHFLADFQILQFCKSFCNYQKETLQLFLVAFAHSGSCCHLFSNTTLDLTRSMHPSLECFCLLPLLKLCAVRPKNFWRILFLVSLSVLGQQFCFPRRPWPVSCQHGKFLWFISQFTGICYSHSLCRLSLSLLSQLLLFSSVLLLLN